MISWNVSSKTLFWTWSDRLFGRRIIFFYKILNNEAPSYLRNHLPAKLADQEIQYINSIFELSVSVTLSFHTKTLSIFFCTALYALLQDFFCSTNFKHLILVYTNWVPINLSEYFFLWGGGDSRFFRWHSIGLFSVRYIFRYLRKNCTVFRYLKHCRWRWIAWIFFWYFDISF